MGHNYVLNNSFIYGWECDWFGITTSKYEWEIEVKISRSDFLADMKKRHKHYCLANSEKEVIVIKGMNNSKA